MITQALKEPEIWTCQDQYQRVLKKSKLSIEFGKTVSLREIIKRIVEEQPKLKRALIDPEVDDPRMNSFMLVNGKEISVLDGLDTKLKDGDELILIPVVHGG